MVKFLVSKGVVLEEMYLSLAASNGRMKIVEYLLSQGLNIHYDNDKALEEAILHNKKDVVILLLEKGASPRNISRPAKEALKRMMSETP